MSLVRVPQSAIWDQLSRFLDAILAGLEQRKREQERLGVIWENIANEAANIAIQSGLPEEEALARAREYAQQIAKERGIQLPEDFDQRVRVRLKVAPRPAVRPEIHQAVQSAIRATRERVSAGEVSEAQAVDQATSAAESLLKSLGIPVPPNLREIVSAYWGVEPRVTEKTISEWFPESEYPWMKYIPEHVKAQRVDRERAQAIVGSWMERIAQVLQERIRSGTATPDDLAAYTSLQGRLGPLYPKVKEEEVEVETRREAPLTPETPAYRVAREYGAPRTYTVTEKEKFRVTGLEGQKAPTLEEVLVQQKREDLIPIIREYNPNLLRVPLASDEIRERVNREVERAIRAYNEKPVTLSDVVRGILAGVIPATEADRRAAESLLAYAAQGLVSLDTRVRRGEALAQVRALSAILSARERAAERAEKVSKAERTERERAEERFRQLVTSQREAWARILASPGGESTVRQLLEAEAGRLGLTNRALVDWAMQYIRSYRAGERVEREERREERREETRREQTRKGSETAQRALYYTLSNIDQRAFNVGGDLRARIQAEVSELQKRAASDPNVRQQVDLLQRALSLVDQGSYAAALDLLRRYLEARKIAGVDVGSLVGGNRITAEFLRGLGPAITEHEKRAGILRRALQEYLINTHGYDAGRATQAASAVTSLLLLPPEAIRARVYGAKSLKEGVESLRSALATIQSLIPDIDKVYPSWWSTVQSILREATDRLSKQR
jgi:hypothetical protein